MSHPTADVQPRVSVVVAARNDDHGGGFLDRIQMFVNALVAQVTRHRLASELVLVDWNSPTPLADVLRWPESPPWFATRVIEVPPDVNAALPFSEELPFREWNAKNVGIRRSHAPFVLAANIDLVFSDDVLRALAGTLRADSFYRVDRVDVVASPDPDAPLDAIIAACERGVVRRHGVLGDVETTSAATPRRGSGRGLGRPLLRIARAARAAPATLARHAGDPLGLPGVVRARWRRQLGLHTDGCGDFTLLAATAWESLHGYPELPGHSVHIDGLFLYECHFAGLEQVIVPGAAFHVDHARRRPPTTRMTAADEGRAPWISIDELNELIDETIRRRGPVLPHSPTWGLAGVELAERTPAGPRET